MKVVAGHVGFEVVVFLEGREKDKDWTTKFAGEWDVFLDGGKGH